MDDKIYGKKNKASRKQQIKMQLTFLNDTLHRLQQEKLEVLADIVKLEAELSVIDNA